MPAIPFRLLCALVVGGFSARAGSLDREIVLAPQGGSAPEDQEISRWQRRAQVGGAGPEEYQRLAWAYVAKARRTLDPGYYKLAEKTVAVLEAEFGEGAESRLVRGHVLHNLHRFKEAEQLARQNVAERGAPADFALLSDALVEQGRIADAVSALHSMLQLKPGLEVSARIAHLRFLKGDLAGAMGAVRDSLATSHPRDVETRAWLLAKGATLLLYQNDDHEALLWADRAAETLVDYAPALFARGRVHLAAGETAAAVRDLQRAEELQPSPEYQWWLADALRLADRSVEAAAVEARLERRGAAVDPRTLALFLATRGTDTARAVKLSQAELRERGDIFSHDAAAWALARAGDLASAQHAIGVALAEGTRDARLFLHAAEIARLAGDHDRVASLAGHAAKGAATLTPSERALLAGLRTFPPVVRAR